MSLIDEIINNFNSLEISCFDDIDENIKNIILITNFVTLDDIKEINSIYIIYNNFKVVINPINDCSISWIEKYSNDFDFLIGKQIKSIKKLQNFQHIYEINFVNSDYTFHFIIKNSYNGLISIHIDRL
jgi:hypothetical protein